MSRITFNKNVASPGDVIADKFSSGAYKYGEIIICNSVDEPGIYILNRGDAVTKINSSKNNRLEADPSSLATPVKSGDTLYEAISKLNTQVGTDTSKTNNVIASVGLNDNGTYKAIVGKYITSATSVASAITLLDTAIEAEKADAIKQGKTYTDAKVKEEIEKLDAEAKAPLGAVFTAITETDGKISADTQMLAVEKDASVTTSNHYNFYLSGGTSRHKWGEIDVPKDQFLKDVSFIASATSSDVTTAASRGCSIVEGNAYLVFNFTTSSGDKWVYTDMTSLVNGLTAKDIKISSAYTKTSYNIHSGTPIEDAVTYMTGELDKLNEKASANTITSTGKTITVTTSATNTNVDVYIDNESIVTNEKAQAGQEGRLSTYINIKRDMESASTATASTRMTYHLVKSGGTYYGGGSETAMTQDIVIPRHFITTDEVTGPGKWVKVGTSAETAVGRYVVDTTKIGLAVQENIKNALGETEAMGNGLTTAWAVREFMKEGIDGDDVMVGWADHLPGSLLSYYGNIADGHILGPVAKANNVHEAVWKVNNNFDRVASSIGLVNLNFTASTYVDDVYKYDSANTQSYKYIKTATTVMGAIKALDTTIENMDFLKDTSSSAHYMTGITQVDGKITEIREAKLPDASVSGDDQGVKVTVAQKDGKLSGLTVEVTSLDTDATITSAATSVVSGKGVRSVIDALNVTDTAVANQYVSKVTESKGKITVTREGLPVTSIAIETEGYVNLGMSATTNAGSTKNSDYHIWVKPDVADTKAALTAATAANKDLAGAYGVKEWIQSLDKTISGTTTQGLGYKIVETDGLLDSFFVSALTLDTDAAITSAATSVVSGKGVRAAIDALDVTKSGTSAGVAVTVAEANGLISAVTVSATTLDTDAAITSAATSVVSGKGVRAAIDALNSTATTTSNAYALTSVTITNGKISAKGETNKIASASTAASADTLDGKHATDLLTEFTNTSTGTNGESRITVGGTSKTCKVNADTVDGYHFVVGSTGTTSNTIYFL